MDPHIKRKKEPMAMASNKLCYGVRYVEAGGKRTERKEGIPYAEMRKHIRSILFVEC